MHCKLFMSACYLLLVSSLTVAQRIIPIDSSHVTQIRIDPENAMGGTVSDVFKEVKYIPLETKPESLLGNVSQLAILNDHFIVLDHDMNAIFVFSQAGKFHAKIKGKPGIKIQQFVVNKWTNQIVYSGDNFQTMTYCDIDGKVVKTTQNWIPEAGPVIYLYSYFIAADQLLQYDQYRNTDSSSKYYRPYSRSLLRFGTPIQAIGFPYSAAQAKIDVLTHGIGPLTTFGNDTTFFFSAPYENTIYTVTPNRIEQTYKLIFPQQISLPNDFMTNSVYDQKRISYIEKNKQLIYCLNNCYQIGYNLLFCASSYVSQQEDNLLYNLQSGNLIALKHILPDAQSWYLPFYDNVSSNFNNIGLAYCDGNAVYTSVSSLMMFKSKMENKELKVVFPPELETYFKKGSAKNNPVIVQLKLKEEL